MDNLENKNIYTEVSSSEPESLGSYPDGPEHQFAEPVSDATTFSWLEDEEQEDVSKHTSGSIPFVSSEPAKAYILGSESDTAVDKKVPKKKKRINGWKVAYLILVLGLILGIVFGLRWVWKACADYQEKSAATLVKAAGEELSSQIGMDLEPALIPTINPDGTYDYVLKSGKQSVAKVTLEKAGSGIMGLALFKTRSVSSMLHFSVILPEGAVIDSAESDYMASAEPYVLPEMRKLDSIGWGRSKTYYKVDVDWLYDDSDIHVSKDGIQLPLVRLGDGCLLAAEYYTGDTCSNIRARAAELSNKYALFMSNDYSYWALDPYIVDGSPLRDLLSSMDMTWFGYHLYTEVHDLVMSDPIPVANRYALINVSFNYDVVRWDYTDRSPIELCLVLYQEDDGYWRLADLENNISMQQELTPQDPWVGEW